MGRAIEIARKRFARGEISREEYETLKDTLAKPVNRKTVFGGKDCVTAFRRRLVFSKTSPARKTLLLMTAGLLLAAVAACGTGEGAPPAGKDRGSAIYAKECQQCHGDAATGEGALPGNPIHGPDGHTWHHADGQLVDIVLGRLHYPGKTMPAFEGVLSKEDVLDVLAYLKTSWDPRQIEAQDQVSENWEQLQRWE